MCVFVPCGCEGKLFPCLALREAGPHLPYLGCLALREAGPRATTSPGDTHIWQPPHRQGIPIYGSHHLAVCIPISLDPGGRCHIWIPLLDPGGRCARGTRAALPYMEYELGPSHTQFRVWRRRSSASLLPHSRLITIRWWRRRSSASSRRCGSWGSESLSSSPPGGGAMSSQ